MKYTETLEVNLPYIPDETPGRQSPDCVLRARRQKEQRRQFERLILEASRTHYVHSTRRQNEQRRLKRVGRLIEDIRYLHLPTDCFMKISLQSMGLWGCDEILFLFCFLYI